MIKIVIELIAAFLIYFGLCLYHSEKICNLGEKLYNAELSLMSGRMINTTGYLILISIITIIKMKGEFKNICTTILVIITAGFFFNGLRRILK